MNIDHDVNKARIEFYSNSKMPLEEILLSEIKIWLRSDERKLMFKGDNYYKGNMDIKDKKRTVLDEYGREIEAKGVSNQKLFHLFIQKLVKQKVSYLMSEKFEIDTDDDNYSKILNSIFNNATFKTLKNIMTQAINKGISWMYPYLEDNKLKFKIMDSKEIIPLWSDSEKSRLDGIIRVYKLEEYQGSDLNIVTKVEFYTEDKIYRYLLEGSKLVDDVEAYSKFGDSYITLEEGRGLSWGKVPFVYFKYNDLMQPLIAKVKTLIDNYNLHVSLNSDMILDTPDSIIHVRNYDGQDPGEFRKNLNTWRIGFTSDDGDMSILDTVINTEAYENHMKRLRRDIFEFGGGVDTDFDSFGNSPSGIALEILYQDLDLDCNEIETEFQSSLEYLMYFIDIYILDVLNQGDYRNETVEFIFNRNKLNNQAETIKSINESFKEGTLSLETAAQIHPYSSENEYDRLKSEQSEVGDELDQFVHDLNYDD